MKLGFAPKNDFVASQLDYDEDNDVDESATTAEDNE